MMLIGLVLANRRRPRRVSFLQVLQQQLELLDLCVKLLRRAAELHPSPLAELGSVLFDAQRRGGQLGLALSQQGAKLGNLLNGASRVQHQPGVYPIHPTGAAPGSLCRAA
jgi:hypothetical protein